jgi:hypothetical protein
MATAATAATASCPENASWAKAQRRAAEAPNEPMSRATCDPELVEMLNEIEKNVASAKRRVIRMSRAASMS